MWTLLVVLSIFQLLGIVAILVAQMRGFPMPLNADLQAALDRITTEVSETGTVEEATVAFIVGLKQELADAVANATSLSELTDRLNALSDALDAKQKALEAIIAPETPPAEPVP